MLPLSLNIESELWGQTASFDQWNAQIQSLLNDIGLALSWPYNSQVEVLLTHDTAIQELNARYRNKNQSTNVLSFPLISFKAPKIPQENSAECDLLGAIVLAYETIFKEATQYSLPFWNHVAHLIVHGSLHLLGYDHETSFEAEAMEAEEIKILHKWDIPNPYE